MASSTQTVSETENAPKEGKQHKNSNESQHGDGKKEKANTKKRRNPPAEPRQGVRKSARREASTHKPSPAQLLKYMLSKEAEDLCRPDDEIKALQAAQESPDGKHSSQSELVTYTSGVFNPFQELVCAVVLSRPISHLLGLRTIRTLFNPPYELTTAEKMRDAGSEKLHQALWDARTQHKAKTADQLSYLAELVMETYADKEDTHGERLNTVLGNTDVEGALAELSKAVKSLGPTGCDIFRRRVQWLWDAAFPFIDSRSLKALQALGLPAEAEELVGLIDQYWPGCVAGDIAGKDEREKKRRALVVVLERATSAQLEGKIDSLMAHAISSTS